MYIRPTVQSASDVPRDPGCLSLAHERGDLDALRRGPQSIAVDHRVAEHHRADAGSSEHQPVDRDTSGLIGVRLDGRAVPVELSPDTLVLPPPNTPGRR